MAKKKFKVVATYITYSVLEVEANDSNEAETIAKNTDGGDFVPSDQYFDWHINDVIEIDHVN